MQSNRSEMQDEEQEEGRALTGNKQKEGMDVNERKGGEKNKGGGKEGQHIRPKQTTGKA